VKRFRPSLRRVLSFAAAGLAGAAASIFIANPALAHNVNTKGVAACDPAGGWNVTWTVASGGNWKPYYKILTVSSTPSSGPIGGELGSLATAYKAVNKTFTGTQHFAGSVTSATLTATARFSYSATEDAGTVNAGTLTKILVDRPTCEPAANVAFASNCDSVTVTLDNLRGSAPVTFNIKGTDKPVNGGQTLDVSVPGDGPVVVKLAGHEDWTYAWAPAAACQPPSLPVTGSSLTSPLGLGAVLLVAGASLIALVFRLRRRRSLASH
jgi:hypothetical protein